MISLSMADETESGLMLMIWLKSLFKTRLVATDTNDCDGEVMSGIEIAGKNAYSLNPFLSLANVLHANFLHDTKI